jgi:hypothetical protein
LTFSRHRLGGHSRTLAHSAGTTPEQVKFPESAYDAAMSAEVSFDEPEPPQRGSDEWLAWSESFAANDPIEWARWATRLRQEDRHSYTHLMRHQHAALRRQSRQEFGLLAAPVRGLIWTMAISHSVWRSIRARTAQARRRFR